MSEPPLGFEVRAVGVEPGGHRVYNEAEWGDAIVVIRSGELELECVGGARRRFRRGDLLWFAGLPLRALHNCGEDPVLLVAVSRAVGGFDETGAVPQGRAARPEAASSVAPVSD